ncbi:MAG: response regulator [Candidatus Kryptoniota bacterium]
MAERKTVLVIDDQKIVLKFTEEFFRRLNFDVHLASDGYEGLKIALSSVPDLILLDIMMPRLDGFKTLQVLKSNELTKNIPAIVMTGYSDRINVLSAGKLGAFAVITKPLTEEILFEKLRELFGERFVQSIIPQDPKEMENPFGVNQEEYDSLVRGMVEEFLKYYSEQVAELEQAIHEKDIDAIRKITHAIKGTGGSFGYDEATTLAVQLNEVVHASSINWNEAEELLVRLKNRLQK